MSLPKYGIHATENRKLPFFVNLYQNKLTTANKNHEIKNTHFKYKLFYFLKFR